MGVEIPLGDRDFSATDLGARIDVAESIVNSFADIVAPPLASDDINGEWTISVRRALRKIRPSGCDYRPATEFSSRGEFLVDFIWEENEAPHRVLLAAEFEWGTDRYGENPKWRPVEEDFEKLLVIKAPYKLLIFSSNFKLAGSEGARDADFGITFARERIKLNLTNYGHHLAGETYIFIDFPRNSNACNGIFRSYFWQPSESWHHGIEIKEGPSRNLNRPE